MAFAKLFTGFGRYGQTAPAKRTPDQIKADIAAAQKKLQDLKALKAQKANEHAQLTQKLAVVQTKIAQIQAGKK